MLTAEQAFRAGFLLRCAQEGLSQDETDARIERAGTVKRADLAQMVTSPLFKFWSTAGATGLLAGGAAGAGLGMLSQGDDPLKLKRPPYLENLQRAELISAYRRYADQARQQTAIAARQRAREAATPRSPYGI